MAGEAIRYFVGVGAQKAGTTWLHDQLVRHPQVLLPARKELHYFDAVSPTRSGESFGHRYVKAARKALVDLDNGVAPGLNRQRILNQLDAIELVFSGPEAYRANLTAGADERTVVAGEVTPAYSTLEPLGFQHMREALDDPAVIYVMRDPVQRYWSAVRMTRPDDLARAFDRAIDLPATWARSDYATTVEALDGTFSRVLYLFYEDLFTPDTLRRVAEFLGVAQEWPWDVEARSNVGRPASMPEPSAKLLERLRPVYDFVRDRFGDAVPADWRRC